MRHRHFWKRTSVLAGAACAMMSLAMPTLSGATEPEKVVQRFRDGSVETTQGKAADGTLIEHGFWQGGARRWEFRFDEQNKQHGVSTRWHPKGPVFVEEQWEHGQKTGEWIYFSDDGRKNARFTYEKDREILHEVWSQPEGRWLAFQK